MQTIKLNHCALYYPFRSGSYEVSANLKRLGFDFGNDQADQSIFQVDKQWLDYHTEKQAARQESINKYVCFNDFDGSLEATINLWWIKQLCHEHPQYFVKTASATNEVRLHNAINNESLLFNSHGQLISNERYLNGFDALAMQIQEDIAVIKVSDSGEDKLTAIHLCFPNHWAAQDKIGHSFLSIHKPVASFDNIAKHSHALVKNMIRPGSFVRFAWGIATDTQLNHHPIPDLSPLARPNWHGRSFDPKAAEAYVRVERQVITGFPELNTFVFTIRTYFHDLATLATQDKHLLAQAIASMSQEALHYKGLDQYHSALVDWLKRMA